MDNKEDYLDALTTYSKNPTPEIPPILEQYLNRVAKNGETLFQWPLLKPLIVGKMEQVLTDLKKGLSTENIPTRPNVENVNFDVMHKRIMDSLQKFNGAPFTIQRLCELLIDPKQHYKRSDKFMRGLEKNVLVVSTVDPFGRKVVVESGNKHLVNGIDLNGSPFFPRDSNIVSNLPPVPGWVTSVSTPPRHTNSNPTTEDEKQSQASPVEAPVTTNGLVSHLYSDSSEQPIAVQTEEVVEETVVTMDTNDVSSVATDGGEALAEEEEEEDMAGDDTNASSTSSSSSSSDELTTSDSGESMGMVLAQTSNASTDSSNRPWASIAKEGENAKDFVSSEEVNSDEMKAKNSDVIAPHQTTLVQTADDEPVSSDVTLAQTVQDEPVSSGVSQQTDPLNHSYGFDTPLAAPDLQASEVTSQSDSSCPVDGQTSTVSCSTTASSSTQPLTYAEVVSGSHRDSETCGAVTSSDSVAVLERLVESVETSSTTSSHVQTTSCPSSTESDEPEAKRFKSDSESENSSTTPDSSHDQSIKSLGIPVNSIECYLDCRARLEEQTVEQTNCQQKSEPSSSSQTKELSESTIEMTATQHSDDSMSQLTSFSDTQGLETCKNEEATSTESQEETSSHSTDEPMDHE